MHTCKRILGLTLIFALLFTLTACAEQRQPSPTAAPTAAPTEETTAEPTTEPTAEPTEAPAAEGSRVLVAYFSATGNTEAVAGYIAETPERGYLRHHTGGALYQCRPELDGR